MWPHEFFNNKACRHKHLKRLNLFACVNISYYPLYGEHKLCVRQAPLALQSQFTKEVNVESGAYSFGNSTHCYLRMWAYLCKKLEQNLVQDWSENKINVIVELSTQWTPYLTLSMEYNYFLIVFIFQLSV